MRKRSKHTRFSDGLAATLCQPIRSGSANPTPFSFGSSQRLPDTQPQNHPIISATHEADRPPLGYPLRRKPYKANRQLLIWGFRNPALTAWRGQRSERRPPRDPTYTIPEKQRGDGSAHNRRAPRCSLLPPEVVLLISVFPSNCLSAPPVTAIEPTTEKPSIPHAKDMNLNLFLSFPLPVMQESIISRHLRPHRLSKSRPKNAVCQDKFPTIPGSTRPDHVERLQPPRICT